ncbi:Membrane protease subunit stomatin/prohibitin-like protein [Burkholderiales bacterium]|jgi:membrane protease subunit HflK|nr:Membrane protease subunit stomatin/prohibitin-like protein [Burkholderiales bacterium]
MEQRLMPDDAGVLPGGIPPPGIGAIQRFTAALRNILRSLGLQGKGLHVVAAFILAAWVLSGIYRVQPDEQGVVLRFGKWVDTVEPGLHYHWPYPIDRVLMPKVTQVNQMQLGGAAEFGVGTAGNAAPAPGLPPAAPGSTRGEAVNQMVTGDENIVIAEYVVFWRIKDAGEYLFRLLDPISTLQMAAESSMHAVIGQHPIQAALSDKRQEIADQAKEMLQRILDRYHAGILITQVQLQRVDPPAAVIDAFNDVQRARADQERARNEAEAYANDVLPRARGEADRMNEEAKAYKEQVVNVARGEIQSFLSVYETYRQAKDVTSWRMYLDSMDQLLKKSGKVIIDSSGKGLSGVVPYLPLSETRDRSATQAPAAPGAPR